MYDTASHVRRRASLGRDAWGFHEGAMPPIGSELASIYPSKEALTHEMTEVVNPGLAAASPH
jgi:hypothetical protein